MKAERKESLEAIKNRVASIEKDLKALGLKKINLWIDPKEELEIKQKYDKKHLRQKKKSGKKSEK